MEEFSVSFLEGKKFEISHENYKFLTDQAVEDGGEGAAMPPFDLFLSSIVACSAMVALGFFRKRNIETKGLKLTMYPDYEEEANRVHSLKIVVDAPPSFPEKYKKALVKSLDICTVKKHILNPPEFKVEVRS